MGMYNEEYLCKSCWHRFLESNSHYIGENMICPKCKSNLFEPIDDIEIDWLINKCKDITKKYYNKLAESKTKLDEINFMRKKVSVMKSELVAVWTYLGSLEEHTDDWDKLCNCHHTNGVHDESCLTSHVRLDLAKLRENNEK